MSSPTAATGAGGNVGSEYVAHAKPDGYTLLLGTAGTHAIKRHAVRQAAVRRRARLRADHLLADVPNILVVNPAVPARTVQEFIDLARAKPGQLNYGSTGNGASTHLAGELFKSMAKIDIVHVPYRGSPPAVTALLANEVQAMFHQVLTVMEQVRAGAVRPLGVSLLHRIRRAAPTCRPSPSRACRATKPRPGTGCSRRPARRRRSSSG
ncbi:MAG: tripartite tricarboxylate transporter substrate-binding protein [Pseudomonadota bacterium]